MEQQFFDFCFNIRDPAEVDQRQTFEIDSVKEQIVGTGDIFYINLVGNRGKVETAEEQTADISNIFFKFNLKIYLFKFCREKNIGVGFLINERTVESDNKFFYCIGIYQSEIFLCKIFL